MRNLILIIILLSSATFYAFEGVIHCTKIQNGVEVHFDFYVKDNKVAVISNGPDGDYRLILDRKASNMVMCVDHPSLEQKGYFTWEDGNFEKKNELIVLSKKEIDSKEIDAEICAGYALVTDGGGAVIYISDLKVDLRGFSKYFNDPVYELLDQFDLSNLPKLISVNKNTGSYTIELKEEEMTVSDEFFAIPSDYVDLNIKHQ